MFFQERDLIAVHSLAAAAHKVLSDLAVAHGKDTIIRNNPHLTRDPKLRSEYYRRIGEAFNFMKHADREPDPNATLEFRPAVTPHFLFDSLLIYHEFGESWPAEFRAFMLWHHCKYPNILEAGEYKTAIESLRQDLSPDDDMDVFYDLMDRLPRTAIPRPG
jgi:hypothetical protein